ncbi:LysE family translocator [Shimia ponticola]|uniref:LysE family translocator n=1 Tax=Shimia ponticola TaxID=2582893 RepID=UPI0011BF23CB|nr:LysE family translocator [Shimia ponticola]
MDPILLWAFIGTTLVFTLVPGPSVALASAQAVRFGKRAAFITVAGDALGTVVHIVIATLGLHILIGLSEAVLPWLQVAGGVYLFWLAFQSLRTHGANDGHGAVHPAHKATFWTGFFACVTNPKAIAFFVALFPGFISPEHPIMFQAFVYGVIFLLLDAALILAYALAAEATFRRIAKRWISVEALSALGLAGVGLGMIIKGWREIPR